MFKKLIEREAQIRGIVDRSGEYISGLVLRFLLAYEFWTSGLEKYNGENWFQELIDDGKFPFPFSVIPSDISWFISTWAELIGAVCLMIGIATRAWSVVLIILTFVAAWAVHIPHEWMGFMDFWMGYSISDNGYGNFKLPLIYLIMFIPLLLQGPGRVSLDHWIKRRFA